LNPSELCISEWASFCGTKERRKQVALMGLDAETAEELFMKYGGHGALATRRALYHMLFVLKQNPALRTIIPRINNSCPAIV
jgi:hypothetical protein